MSDFLPPQMWRHEKNPFQIEHPTLHHADDKRHLSHTHIFYTIESNLFSQENPGLYWVVGGGLLGLILSSNFNFFQSCLEFVLKLFGDCFWTLKAHTSVQYRPKNNIDDHQYRDFSQKFGPRGMVILTIFDNFQDWKNHFLDFFKVGLELFKSCLGIVFDRKSRMFGCIFILKGRYMTSKIKSSG